MDGPDQGTAADRGRLRAARTDRERVIELLKTAFVQDRLDQDEFGARVGQALTARTYAELAALTADLPAGLGAASPPAPAACPPAGASRTAAQIMAKSACWSAICLLVAVILATGGMWYLVSPLTVVAVGILGHGITEVLEERRSRRQTAVSRSFSAG